jgi:hypothetical protein
MLKILTVAVAGVLTVVTLKRIYEQLQSRKARVRTGDSRQPPAVLAALG